MSARPETRTTTFLIGLLGAGGESDQPWQGVTVEQVESDATWTGADGYRLYGVRGTDDEQGLPLTLCQAVELGLPLPPAGALRDAIERRLDAARQAQRQAAEQRQREQSPASVAWDAILRSQAWGRVCRERDRQTWDGSDGTRFYGPRADSGELGWWRLCELAPPATDHPCYHDAKAMREQDARRKAHPELYAHLDAQPRGGWRPTDLRLERSSFTDPWTGQTWLIERMRRIGRSRRNGPAKRTANTTSKRSGSGDSGTASREDRAPPETSPPSGEEADGSSACAGEPPAAAGDKHARYRATHRAERAEAERARRAAKRAAELEDPAYLDALAAEHACAATVHARAAKRLRQRAKDRRAELRAERKGEQAPKGEQPGGAL